jgi:AcrR family transcriptional regulator
MSRAVQLPAPGRGAYDRSLTRAERHAEHRERLLIAAAAALAEGAPTVSSIVAHAGVGRSTFYEFFDSPEHLFEHLEQRALRSLEAALERGLAEARTPLERVRSAVRAWVTEIELRPHEARMLLARRGHAEPLSAAGNVFLRTLIRIAEAAQLDGAAWFKVNDEVTLIAATGALEAVSSRHLMGGHLPDAKRAFAETITKLVR